MHVIRVREFGEPSVLKVEDVPTPVPSVGQVLIDVEVAAVLFGDTIVRSGRVPYQLPYTPGLEVGGRIMASGGDEAGDAFIGRRVVAVTPKTGGGYAQQAAVDTRWVFEVPDGIELRQAVAVFQAGAMALGMLDAMRLCDGETILITAAAGRIGSLLVQAAKAAGATVFGAVGSSRKTEFVAALGADMVVDYSDSGWLEQVRDATAGLGVDVALDAIGGMVGAETLTTLRDGAGRFGTYGFASGEWTPLDTRTIGRRGLTVIGAAGVTFAKPDAEQRADAERALAELAAGRLTPKVHAIFPLEEAPQAHAELEARANLGAILLEP